MRRRALLAANWAYELHLTPEWQSVFGELYVDVYDDFSEVFELLTRMIQTIGWVDPVGNIYLEEIPEEVNITVDGERLSTVMLPEKFDYIEVRFGNYCYGSISPTGLSLNKIH